MNTSNPIEEWPIYNCHMHTFTKQHSPKYFILWVLTDPELGAINGWKILRYLLYGIGYFALLTLLPRAALFLSARSDLLSRFGYSCLLLVQALMVILIVLLVGILLVLAVILLLQGIIDVLIRWTSRDPSVQDDSPLMKMKRTAAGQQSRILRSKLLFDVLVHINPASNDVFERTSRFLK